MKVKLLKTSIEGCNYSLCSINLQLGEVHPIRTLNSIKTKEEIHIHMHLHQEMKVFFSNKLTALQVLIPIIKVREEIIMGVANPHKIILIIITSKIIYEKVKIFKIFLALHNIAITVISKFISTIEITINFMHQSPTNMVVRKP